MGVIKHRCSVQVLETIIALGLLIIKAQAFQ